MMTCYTTQRVISCQHGPPLRNIVGQQITRVIYVTRTHAVARLTHYHYSLIMYEGLIIAFIEMCTKWSSLLTEGKTPGGNTIKQACVTIPQNKLMGFSRLRNTWNA